MSNAFESAVPDFVQLKRAYEGLGNGERADIRRTRLPEDLSLVPAAYKLLRRSAPNNLNTEPWFRVILFLPLTAAQHNPEAPSLGALLARGGVSEIRIIQVARSEYPNDLRYLRQLIERLDRPAVNWDAFGKLLFYWNERNKRRLVEDFYANYDFSKS